MINNTLDIILAIVIPVIMGLSVAVLIFLPKLRKHIQVDEFIRDIPSEWNVGEVGHLFYYYDGGIQKNCNKGRVLASVLLDFFSRNYIDFCSSVECKKEDYFIDVKDKDTSELKEYEKPIYEMLKKVRESYNRPFSIVELKNYAEQNYIYFFDILTKYNKISKKWFISNNYRGGYYYLGIASIWLGMLFALLGFLAIFNDVTKFCKYGLLIGGLLPIILNPKVSPLSKKGEIENKKIDSLKKYLLSLTDSDIIKMPEYLIYATMMGISNKIYPMLKEKYTLNQPENAFVDKYLAFGSSDFGSRISSSLNTIYDNVEALKNPRNKVKHIGGIGENIDIPK